MAGGERFTCDLGTLRVAGLVSSLGDCGCVASSARTGADPVIEFAPMEFAMHNVPKKTCLFFRKLFAALICCIVVAVLVTSSAALAADVEPLRSAELDAQLKAAGFDDSQRARVLAEHPKYVEQFTAVVTARLAEWQVIARIFPSTLEDARALQSKARSAAQSIDEAERPLLEAVRAAARPDQSEATQRVIALLEIRRDLAFASTMREGMFSGRSVDVLEVIEALKLPSAVMTKLQPLLTQYLNERQIAVHRIRDATLNVPTRRVEARAKYPRPPQPVAGAEGVEATRIQEWTNEIQNNERASRTEANAERTASRSKALELDLRTIDSLLPQLRGRDQAHFLSRWWSGEGMMVHSVGPGPRSLKRAWSEVSAPLSAAVASKVDLVCTEWIGAWWPTAKEALLESIRNSDVFMFEMPGEAKGSDKAERAEAATTRASEALDLAIDGRLAEPATNAAAPGVQTASAVTSVFMVGGDAGGIEFSIENLEDEMMEFDGEVVMASVSVTTDGAGGFKQPSALPQLMQFEEIEPALRAAGVDASMMEVAKTAVGDLLTEASAIVKESEALQAGGGQTLDGMFEVGPDGAMKVVDPAIRAQQVATRDALRARLLALEAAKLDEILAAFVPDAGRPCAAWLAPWRTFVSERSATASTDFFGMGRSQLDPTLAVRSAKLTDAELCAVAPELAVMYADLAVRVHSVARAKERARSAMPMDVFSGAGLSGQAPQEVSNGENPILEYEKLERESQRLQKIARMATLEAIPRIKTRLTAEAALRLQEAWENQLYSRDLTDSTSLIGRFESVLAMTLTDAVRGQVVVLEASWKSASRLCREKIVAMKANAQAETDAGVEGKSHEAAMDAVKSAKKRQTEIKAIHFERDELNRRVFRELVALLGADLAAKVQALPAAKAKAMGFTFESPGVGAVR